MTEPRANSSEPPRLTLGRIMGAAVVTGLTGGALFAIRETAQACGAYGWWLSNYTDGLSSILSMAFGAVAWCCPAGCALAVLVGLGAWAVTRVHGYRLDRPWVVALCAGAIVGVVLPSAISLARSAPTWLMADKARRVDAPDFVLLTLFCSIGFACAAYAAGRWTGATTRLAALAAGLVAALFVFACWGAWLVYMKPFRSVSLKGRFGIWVVLALAIGLGVGVHRLCLALLRWRGRPDGRRAMQGAALAAVSVALLAAGSWATQRPRPRLSPPAAPDPRPNVVWLLLDTARADAFSCYGNPRRTSPRVDELAAEATLFERAFANAGWTLPSHASMFTGLLPSVHGTTAEQGILRDDCTTIAKLLAEHGYATFLCSANLNVSPWHNMTQGFQRCEVVPWGRGPEYPFLLTWARKGLHLTDDGAEALNRVAARWIDEAHDAGRPFLLFINYFEVHLDYGSTPSLGRWLPPGTSVQQALRISQDEEDRAAGAVPAKPRDFEVLRALYEGDLTYLDGRVGELIDHLRGLGILDNTLLIVTSDHGEELGEHKEIGHHFGLRNTLLHVPLIVRYPKRFGSGTRRTDIVELTDLFPTILDVAGLAWDGRERLQGRSLLEGPRPEPDQLTVAQRDLSVGWLAKMLREHPLWNALPCLRRQMCIQDRRFKYLWSSDDAAELFDLAADPLEKQDVLGQFPQEAARLRAALEARVGRLRPGLSAAAMAEAARAAAQDTRSKP